MHHRDRAGGRSAVTLADCGKPFARGTVTLWDATARAVAHHLWYIIIEYTIARGTGAQVSVTLAKVIKAATARAVAHHLSNIVLK